MNFAIKKLGNGVGFDGISPDIIKILPNNMRMVITQLMTKVFKSTYPDQWKKQLLLPYPKKDHNISNPKLRGIGIGTGLSRIYDIILNTRFSYWYKPNIEQAGFREGQGCLLHIFSIYLLLDYSVIHNLDLFIIFMDYEKAFDFVNRTLLLEKLLKNGIGEKFDNAIFNAYKSTS